MTKRRTIVHGTAVLVVLSVSIAGNATSAPARAATPRAGQVDREALPYAPVTTPNGSTLPFTMEDGVKVFGLTVEPCRHVIVLASFGL
jgi:hypothetical protein